ncbi:hypothetical protein GCM10023224_33890 [Streptomonospora halophila]|uniref:Uncharacterized protein n=1 Tax=Streptomonospora halophila TaxID=427369 RepID=A0ABP9GQ12_9ACTN
MAAGAGGPLRPATWILMLGGGSHGTSHGLGRDATESPLPAGLRVPGRDRSIADSASGRSVLEPLRLERLNRLNTDLPRQHVPSASGHLEGAGADRHARP